jgi:hypothetical protein
MCGVDIEVVINNVLHSFKPRSAEWTCCEAAKVRLCNNYCESSNIVIAHIRAKLSILRSTILCLKALIRNFT